MMYMFDVHVKHVQLLYMFASVKHVQNVHSGNLYMFVTYLTCGLTSEVGNGFIVVCVVLCSGSIRK